MADPNANRIPPEHRADADQLPPALRALLERELAAGNRIIEVGHSHPAPPAGVYFKLEHQVTTQARASSDGVDFFARNSSLYAGEFCDPSRFYFLLEAPAPPPEEPDMDAIREAANRPRPHDMEDAEAPGNALADAGIDSPTRRFQRSLHINYEKWNDGIGFDLEALAEMSPEEREQIVPSMVPPNGWREVEVLAAIDSPRARDALQHAAQFGSLEVRLAIADRAPQLMSDELRTEALLHALNSADIMSGLSSALDQIEAFHPPVIMDALWRGLTEREGDVAYHCAETLAIIHGAISSRFDWTLRPLFLRFNTDDADQRRDAKRELERVLNVSSNNTLQQ